MESGPARKSMRPRDDAPVVIIGCGATARAAARLIGRRQPLVLCDIDGDAVTATVTELASDGVRATGHRCDITDAASVAHFAGRFGDGEVASVVHVAALAPSCGDWQQLMRVNLIGPTLVAQAFAAKIGAGGSLVLVGSVAAYMVIVPPAVAEVLGRPLDPDFLHRLESQYAEPMTPALAYLLSKAALIAMAERLAVDWGARGIRALSVSPGLIESPMGRRERTHNPATKDFVDRTPLRREGTIDEAAAVIDFAASPAAAFLNGVDLLVDGGLRAAMRAGATPLPSPASLAKERA